MHTCNACTAYVEEIVSLLEMHDLISVIYILSLRRSILSSLDSNKTKFAGSAVVAESCI